MVGGWEEGRWGGGRQAGGGGLGEGVLAARCRVMRLSPLHHCASTYFESACRSRVRECEGAAAQYVSVCVPRDVRARNVVVQSEDVAVVNTLSVRNLRPLAHSLPTKVWRRAPRRDATAPSIRCASLPLSGFGRQLLAARRAWDLRPTGGGRSCAHPACEPEGALPL